MEELRLQKFLANAGVCSRRKAEEYILDGKVKVNGKVVNELGRKVNPDKDEIIFESKIIRLQNNMVYILLNKPIGYVTTVKEQFNRPTVIDLLNGVKEKVLPVGRLDMYTSGALILTNDGDFIYQVTHPKYEIEKTYQATVKGIVTKEDIKKLENGVEILVHIGLNTSKPNEHDFNYHVNVGDHITPDTHILTLSQQFLHSHQFKVITPIIILNSHEHPIKIMTTSSYTKKGKTLFTYK